MTQQIVMGQWSWRTEGQGGHMSVCRADRGRDPLKAAWIKVGTAYGVKLGGACGLLARPGSDKSGGLKPVLTVLWVLMPLFFRQTRQIRSLGHFRLCFTILQWNLGVSDLPPTFPQLLPSSLFLPQPRA